MDVNVDFMVENQNGFNKEEMMIGKDGINNGIE